MQNYSNWIDWWNTETVIRHVTWQKNMEIFMRTTEPLLNYSPQDIILDIGCGPGYLAAFLKDRVKELHCVDTSERYLGICRDKFAEDKNVFFYRLNEDDYTNLSFFKTNKFSIIICLSVIQYYRSSDDVEKLIEEVRRVALPGSKFLIADIPISDSKISGIWALLRSALKEKRLSETVKLFFQLTTSGYRKAYSSLGLLIFPLGKLEELIDKHNLDAQVLRIRMTSNENRGHLLIKF
jgi:ubiquinone/menaquinone biosynthesis C-methylase UbiE